MALSGGWSDAEAVARTPALVRRVGGRAFGQARELSRAAEALAAALAAEEQADQADQQSERSALLAQRQLLLAVRPRVEPAGCALTRAKVAELVDQWADPYAADAAGRPLLDAARFKARAVAGLEDLLAALDEMRAAGLARDRAAAQRAQTIASRVSARRVWDRAHASLCAAGELPPTPSGAPEPDLSGWFTEPTND